MVALIAALVLVVVAAPAKAQDPVMRVLIYGDSNAWGWVPTEAGFPTVRLPDEDRFGGVLQASLGDGYAVVVDGLNNRTTNLDDPQDWGNVSGASFDGAAGLPETIAREMPVDLVVVMLGTNDLKAQFERSAEDVAAGAMAVAGIVTQSTGVATEYDPPRVLVVAPPPFGPMRHPGIAAFYAGAETKSPELADAFAAAGDAAGVPVFDAGAAMGTADGFDGVHFTVEDHRLLGEALALAVRSALDQE